MKKELERKEDELKENERKIEEHEKEREEMKARIKELERLKDETELTLMKKTTEGNETSAMNAEQFAEFEKRIF